jgi:uncharacterized membrane protein
MVILKRIGIGLFAIFTLGVLISASTYPAAFAGLLDLHKLYPPQGPFSVLQAHMSARVDHQDWGFLAHVCGAMVALAVGPFQFWKSLRDKRPGIHRKLGYLYFSGIFVGGIGGLLSAREAWGGTAAQIGFALLALFWMGSSARGLSLIRKGKIEEHQVWMRLSFAITLAGVSLRIQMPLLYMAGLPEILVYQTIAWSCWVPQVLWWMASQKQLGFSRT